MYRQIHRHIYGYVYIYIYIYTDIVYYLVPALIPVLNERSVTCASQRASVYVSSILSLKATELSCYSSYKTPWPFNKRFAAPKNIAQHMHSGTTILYERCFKQYDFRINNIHKGHTWSYSLGKLRVTLLHDWCWCRCQRRYHP